MFLRELAQSNNQKLAKINSKLKELYKVKLSSAASLNELYGEANSLIKENASIVSDTLKVHQHPTYMRNLLMLEGINILIQEKESLVYDNKFESILETLTGLIGESISSGTPITIDDVMDVYESSAGNSQYNSVLVRAIIENFVSATLEEYEEEEKRGKFDTPTWDELRRFADHLYKKKYGNEPVDKVEDDTNFYQPKAKDLAKQHRPGMMRGLTTKLGKNNE